MQNVSSMSLVVRATTKISSYELIYPQLKSQIFTESLSTFAQTRL